MTTSQCLDTLGRVLTALEPGHSFQECLRELLNALTENMHFDRPHIMVQDPESGVLRLSLFSGRADSPDAAYAPGTGITGRVFSAGESMIVPCMHNQSDFRNRLFGRSEEEMEHLAFICVPVRVENGAGGRETIGTLSVDTPTAPADELALRCRFLETVASLVGRQVAWLQEDLVRRHFQMQPDDLPVRNDQGIVAISKSMRNVLRQIGQAGPSKATVLLRGESGVGKELMAQALHSASPRRSQPLVRLNCAALPADLVEGELFGWKKGAFTGALQNRQGLFQQADGGTLFLDEIGDLSPNAQAKVLRALQEGEIQPLGETRTLRVDVRLVCATNRPLETLVEQQLFREDLYYRINVFPVFIPPLRERPEDILPLAEHYLQTFSREYERPVQRISTPAIDLMLQYHWPGNIRELKNVMERAVLVCDDATLRAHHLPATLQSAASCRSSQEGARPGFEETVARVEQEFIVDALKTTRGNIHQAARDLGITYRVIYYKMKKYGIDYRRFLAGSSRGGVPQQA
ncbi:MAG: sigma 54-interacting transcriptional regulator [Desulfovibrionaceae bacterium]|nr:sigma 54-interacting transcriptional regulator [Desulfovibrionaceae bacterium]